MTAYVWAISGYVTIVAVNGAGIGNSSYYIFDPKSDTSCLTTSLGKQLYVSVFAKYIIMQHVNYLCHKGSFPLKEPNARFFQDFKYSRSLKCSLHITFYVLSMCH